MIPCIFFPKVVGMLGFHRPAKASLRAWDTSVSFDRLPCSLLRWQDCLETESGACQTAVRVVEVLCSKRQKRTATCSS